MKRLVFAIYLLAMAHLCVSATTKYALVIGIGPYPKESGWAEINGDKDVPVVVKMLRVNGFDSIYKLVNEKATKENIRKAMGNMAKRCKPGDKVYIHFSGHGQQVVDVHNDEPDDGMDEAWIPYDACARYVKGRYEGQNHILDDELYNWLTAISDKIGNKGRLTVAVDACHSGDISRGAEDDSLCVRGAFADGTRGIETVFRAVSSWLTGKDSPKPAAQRVVKWTAISACRPNETNREYKGGGSLTTALSILADQLGNMTAEEVRVKVRNLMKNTFNFGDHQLPQVNSEGKNKPFI